jgi:hypothetical protein
MGVSISRLMAVDSRFIVTGICGDSWSFDWPKAECSD